MRVLPRTIAAAIITLAIAVGAFVAPAMAEGEKFVFIYHSPDSDSWWNVIKNAIKNAEKDLGVTVDVRNPPSGDLADMARIIEQTTASKPDGMIVTIADFDVETGPIKNAVEIGIPVITVNSGTYEQSATLGAMMHIGQPEYDAGLAAGKRAKSDGISTFVCVNHQIKYYLLNLVFITWNFR